MSQSDGNLPLLRAWDLLEPPGSPSSYHQELHDDTDAAQSPSDSSDDEDALGRPPLRMACSFTS